MVVRISRLLLTGIIAFSSFGDVFSQTVGDYQTAIGFFGSENWSSLAAWVRWNGAAWVQPTAGEGYPGQFSTPTDVTHNDAFATLTLNVSPAFPLNNFTMSAGIGTFSVSGNRSLTLNGNLSIGVFDIFTFGGPGDLIVNGATQIDGFFTDNNNGGTSRFIGTVTLSGFGTWTSTSVSTTSRMNFRGGIVNNSLFFSAGGALFDTNNQALSGGTATSFANNVDITAVTLTNSNTGNLTITGTTTLATSGGFTDSSNSGITTLVGNVSVGVSTSFITTAVTTTANLVFQGGIANSGTFTAGGATFNTNNQSITGGSAMSFANNVAITSVTVTNSNTGAFTITGTTTLSTSGGFTDTDNTSVTTFVGLVTVGASTSFISTVVTTNPNMTFRGGITNNGGTFTAGAGTFDTNNQSLAGTADISFANFVIVTGVTVTNNNTQSVSLVRIPGGVTLTGSGTWTQGANSTLNYTGTSTAVTTFNAANSGNTVNYNSVTSAQTIRDPAGSQYYNLILSGTGNQTKTLSANTLVQGNLSILNTAIFSVGTFSLSVGGNWINSSTDADPFVQGTQTVTFALGNNQTITNTLGETFYNLTVNKSAGTLTLNTGGSSTDVTVTNSLTLTQGIVFTTTADLLTVNDNATCNSGDADSYVDGPIQKIGDDAFTFPTGNGAFWARIGISAPATVTTEFTAQYFDGSYGDLSNDGSMNDVSDNEYWILDRAVTADAVQVTLYWEDATRSQFDDVTSGDLVVARYNGADWTSHGQAAISSAGITGNVTSNVISTFSPITFGSLGLGVNPLPVELIYFTALVKNDQVELVWETASETNNDFFTIERSADGEMFNSIGELIGKGTTRDKHTYTLTDYSPIPGTSYYRLKQTDYDGTFAYSDIVSVTYEGPEIALLKTYPNPTTGSEFTIQITGSTGDEEKIPVVILDPLGRNIYRHIVSKNELGRFEENVHFENPLSPGLYIIKAGRSLSMMNRIVVSGK